MKYTHALVSTVDTIEGIERGVWISQSQESAIELAMQMLVDAGKYCRVAGGYMSTDDSCYEGIKSAGQSLDDFQCTLAPTEFFHVIEIR